MRIRSTTISFIAAAAVVAAAAACGGHNTASPTAPSAAAPPAAAPVGPGATIAGTVLGAGGASMGFRTMGVGLTVTVVGTSSTTTVDNSGHFELRNVPAGQIQLQFSGTGVDARIQLDDVSEHSTITITVRVSGTTAELNDDVREKSGNEIEVEGIVDSNSGGTLTVSGKTFIVTPTTQVVQDGRTIDLSTIQKGDRVHVHGGGSTSPFTATKIQLKVRNSQPPANAGVEVEAKGAIAGPFGGSCPGSRTFTVAGRSVTTTPSTDFKNVQCSALAAGMQVEIKGMLVNGVVQLTRLQAEDKAEDDDDASKSGTTVELKGKIETGSLSGSCAANSLSFKVSGTTVKTNGSTQFKGAQCSSLKAGDSVEVKGTKQADTSVLATRVEKS